jgi:hypothetical protein
MIFCTVFGLDWQDAIEVDFSIACFTGAGIEGIGFA